jgi:hypothetical protein
MSIQKRVFIKEHEFADDTIQRLKNDFSLLTLQPEEALQSIRPLMQKLNALKRQFEAAVERVDATDNKRTKFEDFSEEEPPLKVFALQPVKQSKKQGQPMTSSREMMDSAKLDTCTSAAPKRKIAAVISPMSPFGSPSYYD